MIMHACRDRYTHERTRVQRERRCWNDKRRDMCVPLIFAFSMCVCVWRLFCVHLHEARPVVSISHGSMHTTYILAKHMPMRASERKNMWKIYAVIVRVRTYVNTLHRAHSYGTRAHTRRANGYMYIHISTCVHASGREGGCWSGGEVRPPRSGRPKYLRMSARLREPFSMNNKSPSALHAHTHTHACVCAHTHVYTHTQTRELYAENKIRIKVVWNFMVLKYSLRSNVIQRAARHCDGHSWLRCCCSALYIYLSCSFWHSMTFAAGFGDELYNIMYTVCAEKMRYNSCIWMCSIRSRFVFCILYFINTLRSGALLCLSTGKLSTGRLLSCWRAILTDTFLANKSWTYEFVIFETASDYTTIYVGAGLASTRWSMQLRWSEIWVFKFFCSYPTKTTDSLNCAAVTSGIFTFKQYTHNHVYQYLYLKLNTVQIPNHERNVSCFTCYPTYVICCICYMHFKK